MASLTFDRANKVIVVDAPATEINVQELYDKVKDYEDEEANMDLGQICSASGKEDLGGGVFVGLTVKLLDWLLQFEDRLGPTTILCEVFGGNLVAVDESDVTVNPIKPSTFVMVVKTSSSSATIAQLDIKNLQYLIEFMRPHHTGSGDIFYWDPTNGDDDNSGTSPERSVKTFVRAHGLVTSGAHDVIFIRDTAPVSTVITETIEVTKDLVFLRGPGRGVKFKPVGAQSVPTIRVSSFGVELSGFAVETSDTPNNQNCITVDNSFTLIENCWVAQAGQHGVEFRGGKYSRLQTSHIEDNAVDGVHFTSAGLAVGEPNEIRVHDCHIHGNGRHGIALEGPATTPIRHVTICMGEVGHNAGYGIDIGTGVEHTVILSSVFVVANVLGTVNDGGVATLDELYLGRYNVGAIDGSAEAAQLLRRSAGSMVFGTVSGTSFTPTETQFVAGDILFTKLDHLKGRALIFTYGELWKQGARIDGYEFTGQGGKFTVTALSDPPEDGATFIVV